MEALTGVTLTQGASTQDALRRAAHGVGEVYEDLRTAGPAAPVVHTDDTRWRVGGKPAYLMACETEVAMGQQVRSQHRHEEVQEVIPPDYEGVMVTDRGRSYEARAFDTVKHQKGRAHILRSISAVLQTTKGRARDFGERLKGLWQDAMQLWRGYHTGAGGDFAAQAQGLQDALTHHRRNRCLTEPDHQRLLNQLGRHHDRGNLLRFLEDPHIEPTNNRAERARRPAVSARQGSQCAKNDPGAHAFAAFTSVVHTLAKQGVASMVEGLYQLFRSTPLHTAPP